MTEDILEQLVVDYLQIKGYYTRNNIKFKPAPNYKNYSVKEDCVNSDIDVVGINPNLRGSNKIIVVGCKSWQNGFDPKLWIDNIDNNRKVAKRDAWKYFREIANPKWSRALIDKIYSSTGSRKFTYVTAVTWLKKGADKSIWEQKRSFVRNIRGNPIIILTFSEMLEYVQNNIGTTVEGSQLGRTLQLIKASRRGLKNGA